MTTSITLEQANQRAIDYLNKAKRTPYTLSEKALDIFISANLLLRDGFVRPISRWISSPVTQLKKEYDTLLSFFNPSGLIEKKKLLKLKNSHPTI